MATQHPTEKMMDEMSEYVLLVLRSLKKSFQFRRTEEAGGFDRPAGVAGVGCGCDVVEAFRTPIRQIEGVKKEPGGLAGGGVAERRESLEDARRCVGLY